jgi:predicted heme/steroid binding protein/putative copper export protein
MLSTQSGRLICWSFALLLFVVLFPVQSFATPEYALQTGFECKQCHVDVIGGGALTGIGKQFLSGLKAKGQYRPLSSAQRVARLIIGYVHMLAAIAWFGTIMYVHILLKPAYASKGLPKGELKLGWISMIALLVTGAFLTIARVPSFEMLYSTRFGILLSIKIFLYLIMLSSAAIVTLFIGPKLRKQKTLTATLESGICSLEELSSFDGINKRPSYFAYQGTIYDVTLSKLWKNGSHMMKHSAGNDLTDALSKAPHGEDRIVAMPKIGRLLASGEKIARPFHIRLFYFFAYMNLVLVFIITFVIALWRWW